MYVNVSFGPTVPIKMFENTTVSGPVLRPPGGQDQLGAEGEDGGGQ